jgi:hypothetical protein
MMRQWRGLSLVALGVALMVVEVAPASNRSDGFDAVVNALSQRYGAKPMKVPLMWMVGLCARGYTHDGVRKLKIAEFEHFGEVTDPAEFEQLVRSNVGREFSLMVRERKAGGEESLIYAKSGSGRTELIVLDLDHGGELNMVGMDMNPTQLSKWIAEHDHDRDSD